MSLDEFKLIELVKLKPALWDDNSVFYRDTSHKSGIWNQIAEELGCTVDIAQTAWHRLRNTYLRKKQQSEPQAKAKKWDKAEVLKFLDKPATAESSNQANVSFDDINLENLSLNDSTHIETPKPAIKTQKHETDISLGTQALPTVAPSTSTPFPTNKNKKPSKCKNIKMQDPESIDDLATALLSAFEKVALNMGTNSQIPTSRNITESFIKLYSDQMYHLFENMSETQQRRLRNRFSVFMDDLFEEFEL